MLLDYAVSAFLTLFVVVDPIGLTPTFLAVTEGLPRPAQHSVAIRASIIAGAILAGSALIGDWLLQTLQISLAAFRIAGGLLLFSIASEMVFGVRIRRESEAAEQAVGEHVRNIAAFPLAIPLMAGPGAITATILLAGHARGNLLLIVALVAIVILVAACCVIAFAFAGRISRLLGMTGNIVLSRLLGVLLAALAVQYVVGGVRAIFSWRLQPTNSIESRLPNHQRQSGGDQYKHDGRERGPDLEERPVICWQWNPIQRGLAAQTPDTRFDKKCGEPARDRNRIDSERPNNPEFAERKSNRPSQRKTRDGLQGSSGDHHRFLYRNDKLGCDGNDRRIARTASEQHERRKAQPHAEHRRGGEHMDELNREDDVEHRGAGSTDRSAAAGIHALAGHSRATRTLIGAGQNGISSSMSPRSEPPAATAAFRVGPGEPKPFSSAAASPPAGDPARSSKVSSPRKPCSTTSVE